MLTHLSMQRIGFKTNPHVATNQDRMRAYRGAGGITDARELAAAAGCYAIVAALAVAVFALAMWCWRP